jgi:hypothetical protein
MKALNLTVVAAALALMVGLSGTPASAAMEDDARWLGNNSGSHGQYQLIHSYRNYGYRRNRHGYRYGYGHGRRYYRRHRYSHYGPGIYFRAPGFGFHFGY